MKNSVRELKNIWDEYLTKVNIQESHGTYDGNELIFNGKYKGVILDSESINKDFILHSNDVNVFECTLQKLNDRKKAIIEIVSKIDFSITNHNLVIELEYNNYYTEDAVYVSRNIEKLIPGNYEIYTFDKQCTRHDLITIIGKIHNNIIIIPKTSTDPTDTNNLLMSVLDIVDSYKDDTRTSIISQNKSKLVYSNNIRESLSKIQIAIWFNYNEEVSVRGTKEVIIPFLETLYSFTFVNHHDNIFETKFIKTLMNEEKDSPLYSKGISTSITTKDSIMYISLVSIDQDEVMQLTVKYVYTINNKEENDIIEEDDQEDIKTIYSKLLSGLIKEYIQVTKEKPQEFSYRESLINMITNLESIK